MRCRFAFLGLLFWISSAYAVSRVGTGTLWNDEVGFLTSRPPSFAQFSISPGGNMVFGGPRMIASHGFAVRPRLDIYLLHNVQPEWVGHRDRQGFENHFLSLGWIMEASAEPCVAVFRKDNGSSMNMVLSWGDGRGVLVSGESRYDLIREGMDHMSADLQLLPGACAWN